MNLYCLGETVLDIIIKGLTPVSANPGGSTLNSAVSLARARIPVSFISEVSDDHCGRAIKSFLDENKVNTDYFNLNDSGRTKIALAFLNDENAAEYQFYQTKVNQRLDFKFPSLDASDILLFGSYYAIDREISDKVGAFLRRVKDDKAMMYYDINFRKPHLKEKDILLPQIEKNIKTAHIVKGSDEDFALAFGFDFKDWVEWTYETPYRVFIRTAAEKDVHVSYGGKLWSFSVPPFTPINTVGAGDNFNAGFLYAYYQLVKEGVDPIAAEKFNVLIDTGNRFARECCMSNENYVGRRFVM